MTNNQRYAYTLWRWNRALIRLAMPIPVWHFRITGSSFGFATVADRDRAQIELRRWCLMHPGWFVSFTPYKDTQADIAAQVILWPVPNPAVIRPEGGYHFQGGRPVSSRNRALLTRAVAERRAERQADAEYFRSGTRYPGQ